MSLPYSGPTALGHSKFAPSTARRVPPGFPSAVSSTTNTIATKEQIAVAASRDVSALEVHNSGADLAVAQGNALKDDVEKHTAKLSRTVSTAVTSTRQLLQLIREALKEEDALKIVDDLWAELEALFEAAKGARDALPDFLEKQRNNMALYHGAMMNETYQETQQELNMQHKKVNVQHGVILEQQQAFQDYKVQITSKLQELEDLRERVSRLVLEKGNLKDEIDKYAKMLETEQSTKAEDLEKANGLQKELEALVATKTELLAEVEGLQKTISDMQEKMQTAELTLTDKFTAELKVKADLLVKEIVKSTGLTTLINTLKSQESNGKMAIEKLKAENKMLNEKYTRVASEHSQTFFKSKEHTQKIESLTAEADRLREENATMRERLEKLPALGQAHASLLKDKADLLEQLGKLSVELTQAKESCAEVNKQPSLLTAELQAARSQNDVLRSEKSDLLSKQQELTKQAKNATQAVMIFKNENATLRSVVDKLKAYQPALAVGGVPPPSSAGQAVLEQQVQDLTEQKDTLQKALEEWTALAKRSYTEYKQMVPTFKQAEQHRLAVIEKEEQIKALKLELSSAKMAPKTNGVAPGGDAAYWKAKYEKLMASVSN